MRLLSHEDLASYVALLTSEDTARIVPECLTDDETGPLLRNYLVLERGILDHQLSEADRFYNRYYWWLRFACAHKRRFGADAGIEQWGFKILETADFDTVIDCSNVEQIDKLTGYWE